VASRLFGPYGALLARPGAAKFVASGWLGRMARSTSGISSVLLVAGATGSYALAGSVAGAIVLGGAIGAPLWARAVDRYGQLRILPLAFIPLVIVSGTFATIVLLGFPVWLWFVLAFLVGATAIDTGSMVRSRWVNILDTPEQRHSALALEAVNDELVFVIGPPITTLLATLIAPVYGFAAGILIALVGGIGLYLQRSTVPKLTAASTEKRGFWLPAGVLAVFPLYPGVGIVFGSIDVSVVAVGNSVGMPWVAGAIVAVFAGGSVISGLPFGHLTAKWSPAKRVLVASLTYAVFVPVLLLATNIPLLLAAGFLCGVVTVPVLISGSSMIATRVDRARLTEAMAWPSVGLSAGVILGSTLTGIAIDNAGAFAGFGVSTAGALVVGLLGITCVLLTRQKPALVSSAAR
jgi:MFS family permease